MNQEIDYLLEIAIRVGNKLTDISRTEDTGHLIFAEGLGQKILWHSMSAKKLYDGNQLTLNGVIYAKQIDFASIAILTRAAMETYLTLNFIFLSAEDENEKKFRFACWHLAGYLERVCYKAKSDEHEKIKLEEELEIYRLRTEILNMPYFKNLNLSQKQQKNVVEKGNWKIFRTWKDLAVIAGFNENYFEQHYSYLCSYAHSGRLSVLQIKHTKHYEDQKRMAESSIQTLSILLAKFTYDYIQIMPWLKSQKYKAEDLAVINIFKMAGEQLQG